MKAEKCENCGREIGRLETPRIWKNHVVCPRCYDVLGSPSSAGKPNPATAVQPAEIIDLNYAKPAPKIGAFSNAMKAARTAISDVAIPVPTPQFYGQPGQMICPNPRCGYVGRSRKVPRGSMGIGCLLMLFFLVPGILYFIFRSGYRYVCPNCGVQISSDS